MGTKYVLSGPYIEDNPDAVEGFRHWVTFKIDETAESVVVVIKYWKALGELARVVVSITRDIVVKNGGTDADWATLLVKADNSSDTDDVVMEMASPGGWGSKLLWGRWRSVQGQ